MKKYDRLILFSLVLYILTAIGTGYGVYGVTAESGKEYKIEINRLYNSLSGDEDPDRLNLRSCKYVKNVAWLPAGVLSEASRSAREKIDEFYEQGNLLKTEIRPWYEEGDFKGFVRFDYVEPDVNYRRIIWITQICLALMEGFLLAVLFYLRSQLVRPFQRMADLPHELAMGHLKGTVTEEKSRFFSNFLWGIGQLKDTLDTSKKRELKLQKEKKLLLLSLSHDIKTPLNTIKLYGRALEEDLYPTGEQKKQAARQIEKKADEIERYVEEIMKNAREDILDIQVRKEEFYLTDLMDKVLDTYREKCRIRMIDLTVGKFENRLIIGDPERTMEVFENLFENAFKYGDGRRIEITFYEEDYRQLIRIFNTGSPVTDTEFNHVFESFFRAGNSEGKQGNGLGLYICREIMRKMDGEIFAEKSVDGMAFVLVFR